ncbi:CopD family protein [Paenibacillus sp. FSL H8-0537]|uniref:copper resistance D family protein n=1 Tax=Paenibacillus sp. FSL H8-0537 TaxID=2921399 RepID=UPI0031011C5D
MILSLISWSKQLVRHTSAKIITSYAMLSLLLISCALLVGILPSEAHAARSLEPQQISGVLPTLAASFNPHEQVGHDQMENMDHGHDSGLSVGTALFYTARIVYYITLLLAAGLMLWFSGIRLGSDEQRKRMQLWSLPMMRTLLLASLLYVFASARSLMEGYGGGGLEWVRLFTGTNTGQAWLALLILSLLGFIVIRASDTFKLIWALLLLAIEGWSGHMAALQSNMNLGIVLDFIHLACAASWSGGLMILLGLWFADRKEAGRFAERFTTAAWISMALLVITGAAITWLLLPSLSYLFYTSWGIWLLVKIALVVLVIVTGALLRARVRRGELPHGLMLKVDAGLMLAITLIVGVFTYMSPIPDNTPVRFHKMGETRHFTVNITPNEPGANQFEVKIWLPEQLGEPTDVKLVLHSRDKQQLAPLEVPLAIFEDTSYESFPGFVRTSYHAEQMDIPFPGKWTAELQVVDKSGGKLNESIDFKNY